MKKIERLLILIAVVMGAAFAPLSFGDAPNHGKASAGNYLVYIGTYTSEQSKGIYAYRFDAATGRFKSLGLVADSTNPSFLSVDPRRRFLYAVNEIGNLPSLPTGRARLTHPASH